MFLLLLLPFVAYCDSFAHGEGWNYTCFGNCNTDAHSPTGGTIIVGGGTDVDAGFVWMIQNSGGGDILVMRTSGTDAYNPYIFGLGKVNSVATLVISHKGNPSSDPFVLKKIRDCEGLWFAGGDQWTYYDWWKSTPVNHAITYLIREKKVTIGGTSAGMAIQASYPYVAKYGSADSKESLNDPYNKYVTIGSHFIEDNFLSNTIFETHFFQRDRMGRILTFVARLMTDNQKLSLGIACDESTAVLIDQRGIGTIRTQQGKSKNASGLHAYFFKANQVPEACRPGKPLTFENIQVYRLSEGNTFDFTNWNSDNGARYELDVVGGKMSSQGNDGNIY